MKLKIKGVERYCQSVEWEGCYNSIIRSVKAVVMSGDTVFACGDSAELFDDSGKRLLLGTVTERTRQDDEKTITLTAEDRGFYLKQNKASLSFVKKTPKAVVQKIASDYGIPLGKVANPSYQLTRNFYGINLYNIIATAYTLAADGKRFFYPHFDGDGKLCVTELAESGDKTLYWYQSAQYKESIKNMVNVVRVYDSDNKLVATYKDAEDLKKYGQLSDYLRKTDDMDVTKEAKKRLSGLEQSIRITKAMGNTGYVTGEPIVVKSPLKEAYGLFWITSDRHRWDASGYTVDLELSFERMMAEVTSGSEVEKKGGSSSGSVSKSAQSGSKSGTAVDGITQKVQDWNSRKP